MLRLTVAGFAMSRPVGVHSGRLPHDQVHDTATIDNSIDLLLPLLEELLAMHRFFDLALPELLIGFFTISAEITVKGE